MAYHHGSIRKYTAALIDLFNEVEVQYQMSTGETITKKVPLTYSSKEKAREFDKHTAEQLRSGNYNVLPRGSLAFVSLDKHTERTPNKNLKINKFISDTAIEFAFNSISYDFSFEINFQCRGMNEATQIMEQIAPIFNPTVNIDIWDAQNLSEPTRIPVRLLGISFENEDYNELSSNIVTVVFNVALTGNLYQPIKSIPRINEFDIYLNQIENDTEASRKDMLAFDVDINGNVI